jgi:hypothetical protein
MEGSRVTSPKTLISQLPSATTPFTGQEQVPLDQAGVTSRATLSALLRAATPGGSNGQVQFNNDGALGGLTEAQLTALIDTFTANLSGAVPAPGVVSGKFLRDDGTWETAGGGSPVVARDLPAAPVAFTNAAALTRTINLPALAAGSAYRVSAAIGLAGNTGQYCAITAQLRDHTGATLDVFLQISAFKAGSPEYGGGNFSAIFQDLGGGNGQAAMIRGANDFPSNAAGDATAQANLSWANTNTLDLSQACFLDIIMDARAGGAGGSYYFSLVELL